jgi:hypothetical protein
LKSLQGFELPRELAGLQDASALPQNPKTPSDQLAAKFNYYCDKMG